MAPDRMPIGSPESTAFPHSSLGAAVDALLELLEGAGAGRWVLSGSGDGAGPGAVTLAVPGADDVFLVRSPSGAEAIIALDVRQQDLLARVARIIATVIAADRHAMEVEEQAARAEQESCTDPLTGVANARSWWRTLSRQADHCDTQVRSAVVAVVDLDELKIVNDRQGHLAGDLLLRAAANALAGAVGEHDHVARVGGDEFGVLLMDTEIRSPRDAALRLEAALDAAGVRASVGAARYDAGGRINDTYHRADRAMYRIKATRPGRRPNVA